MLKIALLGGSNSGIIKIAVDNYIKTLKINTNYDGGGDKEPLYLFQDGSQCLQNLSELIVHKNEISTCDLIITESNINDIHRHQASRYNISIENTQREIFLLYKELYKLNKKVLVVIASSYPDQNKTKTSVINNIHRYYVNKFGFNCVDFDSFYKLNNIYSPSANTFNIDNFASDSSHELFGLVVYIIFNILKQNHLLHYPKKNIDFNDVDIKVVDAKKLSLSNKIKTMQKSYKYTVNFHIDDVVEINKQPLIINNCSQYTLRGINTYIELDNNTDEVKNNFYNTIVIENSRQEKVVKYQHFGREFEHILDSNFSENSICFKIFQNFKNLPITEHSWHENLSLTKPAQNTNNSRIYFLYAILIKDFFKFKIDRDSRIYSYLNFDDYEKHMSLIKNRREYIINIENTYNLNHFIPDLSFLIDIVKFYRPLRDFKVVIEHIKKLNTSISAKNKENADLTNKLKAAEYNNTLLKKSLVNANIPKYTSTHKKLLKLLSNPYIFYKDARFPISLLRFIFVFKKPINLNINQIYELEKQLNLNTKNIFKLWCLMLLMKK